MGEELPALLQSMARSWHAPQSALRQQKQLPTFDGITLGYHRLVLMSQPVSFSVLEARVTKDMTSRARETIDRALHLVNFANNGEVDTAPVEKVGAFGENDGSSRNSLRVGIESTRGLLSAHFLDFAGLLEKSYDDPEAPPDTTRPILEDGMHYGCQVLTKGFKFGRLEASHPGIFSFTTGLFRSTFCSIRQHNAFVLLSHFFDSLVGSGLPCQKRRA